MIHPLTRVEQGLGKRMLALAEPALKPALAPYLDGGQIEDIVQRRDRMKKEIDKLVAEKGEAGVLLR